MTNIETALEIISSVAMVIQVLVLSAILIMPKESFDTPVCEAVDVDVLDAEWESVDEAA